MRSCAPDGEWAGRGHRNIDRHDVCDRIVSASGDEVYLDPLVRQRERRIGLAGDEVLHPRQRNVAERLTPRHKRRLDLYMDEPTQRVLFHRFGYCFVTPPGSQYPPIANEHRIAPGTPLAIKGEGGAITALPFLQDHGDICSIGYRFGALAYSTDLVNLPDASIPALAGLDVWIVDALRYKPHPSHWSVDETLAWIDRIRPKRAILTNLHSDLDYSELKTRLPAHVEPAYDGMIIKVEGNS